MRIVVCEDNAVHQQETRRVISKVLFEKEDIIIRCFSDGEELLEAIAKEPDFYADMIFMDIKMPRIDGIQAAKQLLKRKKNMPVVFLTAHSEYVFQGYEVHAYDYILKPVTEKKLQRVFARFIEERDMHEEKYLIVNKRTGRKKIQLEQVLYFVSDKRKLTAVMEGVHGKTEFYMSMRELEKQLSGYRFFRCHQSFLINTAKVTEWDSTSVKLEGGAWIPISKKYKSSADKTLAERQKF